MILNDMKFAELKLNNPGVLIGRLPTESFDSLKTSVRHAIDNKISKAHDLVGMIEELYAIRLDNDITDYLMRMAYNYQKLFNFKTSHSLRLTDPWINLQKKHEYSPVHHHPRTLGWVIWVKIPYDLEKEMNMPNSVNSRVKKNSNFEFVYANLGGEIQTHAIPVDRSYEGVAMMFPGYLRHTVYPFYTSDDCRISVAGNIELVSINS